MSERTRRIDNVEIPRFLYGTAWKEDQTQRLTELALRQGFRGIDTANQRRHYHEEAVGKAISAAIADNLVRRDELFLQSKFTFQRSQDHRLPYDPHAPVAAQVEQSFASSLTHLGVDRLDSYLLHGPTSVRGLAQDDWSAWRAMEELQDRGLVRWLGISNVARDQLDALCQAARIAPRFVQNRCYAVRRWDQPVRQFCESHEIVYQGFSLLTANRSVLTHPAVIQIAQREGWTVAQTIFRFALDVGMLPLTGTSNAEHMRLDLSVMEQRLDLSIMDQRLTPSDIQLIESCVIE